METTFATSSTVSGCTTASGVVRISIFRRESGMSAWSRE